MSIFVNMFVYMSIFYLMLNKNDILDFKKDSFQVTVFLQLENFFLHDM